MEVEVGSVYRVDRSTTTIKSLPPCLSSIRAVLVDKKGHDNVTVVFPTSESLRRFLRIEKLSGSMQPNLDKKCMMSLSVCNQLLTQKVPFQEFATQRGNPSFWFLDDQDDDRSSSASPLEIKWGRRRRSTRLSGKLSGAGRPPSVVVKGESPIAKTLDDHQAKDEKQEEDNEEEVDKDNHEDEDNKERITEKRRTTKKRKCQFKGVNYTDKKRKKKKPVMKEGSDVDAAADDDQKKPMNLQHRWTTERYKSAEKNMLMIMKAKGAVPGNPILRPELRMEARKLIGDTGLLDHLLKHMAGKLAPGGKERFRRRHNPEGAMEYWLESADLVDIRKKEGIKDPYWVPPPGWKPGDSPNQDPLCARELNYLKQQVETIKRQVVKLACTDRADKHQALIANPAGLGNVRVTPEEESPC